MTGLPDAHVKSLASLESGYWWYEGRLHWARKLIEQMTAPTGESILCYADFGCGTGGFVNRIHRTFKIPKAWAVDGDPNVLKHVSTLSGVRIHQQDFAQPLSLPDTPDLVTCMDVIEHLEDDVSFLEQVYRILRPGGHLLVSVPALPSLFSSWDTHLGHHRRYTAKTIRETLNKSGFKVKRVGYMWSALVLPGYYRKWKDKHTKEELEFPEVGKITNSLLVQYAKMECLLRDFVNLPFGTSLVVSATKPHRSR